MKTTVKVIVLGAAISMMVACTSQKEQANTNRRPSGQQGGPPNYAQLLAQMDAYEDGKLSQAEVKGPLRRDFSRVDSNGDGFITKAELESAPRPQRGQGSTPNRQ